MKLERTNFNGEIVLGGKLNHVEFFSERCSKCPENKIVYNFLITNPNGMNKSYPHRQKYNL